MQIEALLASEEEHREKEAILERHLDQRLEDLAREVESAEIRRDVRQKHPIISSRSRPRSMTLGNELRTTPHLNEIKKEELRTNSHLYEIKKEELRTNSHLYEIKKEHGDMIVNDIDGDRGNCERLIKAGGRVADELVDSNSDVSIKVSVEDQDLEKVRSRRSRRKKEAHSRSPLTRIPLVEPLNHVSRNRGSQEMDDRARSITRQDKYERLEFRDGRLKPTRRRIDVKTETNLNKTETNLNNTETNLNNTETNRNTVALETIHNDDSVALLSPKSSVRAIQDSTVAFQRYSSALVSRS